MPIYATTEPPFYLRLQQTVAYLDVGNVHAGYKGTNRTICSYLKHQIQLFARSMHIKADSAMSGMTEDMTEHFENILDVEYFVSLLLRQK